jgi:hypothetical protein
VSHLLFHIRATRGAAAVSLQLQGLHKAGTRVLPRTVAHPHWQGLLRAVRLSVQSATGHQRLRGQ